MGENDFVLIGQNVSNCSTCSLKFDFILNMLPNI